MTKLARGRAPNYRLLKDFGEYPQGTFVRPVEFYHLPAHIKKEVMHFIDQKTDVVCFMPDKTHKVVPRKYLEET